MFLATIADSLASQKIAIAENSLRLQIGISGVLREAKPGGFQTGGFPTFFGKGPDCGADPFGTVPRRCS